MKLAFLQNLENLGLDGEAFLAQFLEFLLDHSLNGNKKYDSLIWSTAQVLDLKLPISTVSSAFALLQVRINENKQNNINQKTNSPSFHSNSQLHSNSANSNFSNSKTILGNNQNENQDLDSNQTNSQNLVNKKNNQINLEDIYPQNSSNSDQKLNSLNPNCIQKVDLEENRETGFQEDNFQNTQNISNTESQILSANHLQDNNLNSNRNSDQNQQIIQVYNRNSDQNTKDLNQISNSSSSNISLSQIHAFLINKIRNSKEMNLKLLLTDLALEKIDLEAQTGVLTLSSGALLNFLKNKKSLDWISQNLEDEFGWKISFAALQRETKIILFPNDTILPITKVNYKGNQANLIPTSNFDVQVIQNTKAKNEPNNINNPTNPTKNQLTNEPTIDKKDQSSQKQVKVKEIEKTENILAKEILTEKKFYKLYSKNGDFPFNFADKNVDLIFNIPFAVKEEINWEEFTNDFELE